MEKESEKETNCPICHQMANKPNHQKIAKCKEIASKSVKHPPDFLRSKYCCDTNLENYLEQDLYCWFPQKMFPLEKVHCWDPMCRGENTIATKEINSRGVEGISSNGFIIFQVFKCKKCAKTRSSLDIDSLLLMGFPKSTLRRCPVVTSPQKAVTKELYSFIMSHMTSELGAGQISSLIRKERTFLWCEQAMVYLGAVLHEKEEYEKKQGLGGFGYISPPKSPTAFPPIYSHCSGYGGSQGLGRAYIADIFLSGNRKVELLADQVMQSLGGQVLSADHTFNVVSRIRATDNTSGRTFAPVNTFHGGKYKSPLLGSILYAYHYCFHLIFYSRSSRSGERKESDGLLHLRSRYRCSRKNTSGSRTS